MRVVNTVDELLTLPLDKGVNGFRTRIPVRLEIPALTKPVLVRAQFALNDLQERGGSFTAAAFFVIALIAGVVEVFQRNASLLNERALIEFGIALVFALAAGALGKYVAMIVTRWQFAQRCRVQHRHLSEQLQQTSLAAWQVAGNASLGIPDFSD